MFEHLAGWLSCGSGVDPLLSSNDAMLSDTFQGRVAAWSDVRADELP